MSRPLSAANYNSSKMNNFNKKFTLEIIPKTVNYHGDGTGRDGYIKFSNGGFHKDWNNNFLSKSTSKKFIKNSKDF